MQTFVFPPKFIARFSAYLDSEEYHNSLPSYSKTAYWKEHSGLVTVEISGTKVTLGGVSGYYIPALNNNIPQIIRKAKTALKSPSLIASYIKRRIERFKKPRIKLLDYFEAFDAVMSHNPIAEIPPAKQRINFIELSKNPNVIPRIKEMRERFFAKDKYSLSPEMVHVYYLWNIICGKVDIDKVNLILEIGAGNGNLSALLWHKLKAMAIIVDLPETLCLSIPFIADLFPDANILMPHEVNSWQSKRYDFIFLTPNQLNWIKDNSVDLAMNIFSFQEMNYKQIKEYFDLIKRAGKDGSYFLTENRVEKIPLSLKFLTPEASIRFSEYPWMPNNEVLVYEICSLCRLVQLSDLYIRLEKIIK